MRIQVKAIPNAARSEVIVQEDGSLKIKVQNPPEDGKANKAILRLIAKHYQVPPRNVKIVSGEKSHQKIIEVFGLQNLSPSSQ
ncbi:MAG: DUF167 domain-containing protein [Verrucomicrobiota bacterium]|nr:MAG: DUF167 domain-containing protein [Verrucomicrobiota bacterium]